MSVTYKKHITTTGKEIHIYDGLIPLSLRDYAFRMVNNSSFIIGWTDGPSQNQSAQKYLHSRYSEEDTINLGLFEFLKTTDVNELIKDLKLEKSIVNLSFASDIHWAHTHPEKLVVLYYVNLEWQQHWHGETLFYSDDLNEIELAVRYTPGRIIAFDASIPHSIRPQSTAADSHRFTYAMTFN